jgi:hypothetical protein
LISAWAKGAGKSIAAAPKVSFPSLGYLASYARIAIQISKISREQEKWRSARAIKLRISPDLG